MVRGSPTVLHTLTGASRMKPDSELKQDLINEINRDPSIGSVAIAVEVKDGTVALAGRLTSYSQKCTIARIAQHVPGVKSVMMKLIVDLPEDSKRPDAEIAKAAEHNLRWTNFLPRDHINVVVHNGHISLSGTVDWAYQRLGAEQAVCDLYGVTGVGNDIKVLQEASSPDIKAMIEAEELIVNRRAFPSPQCVDYPDVVGVDRQIQSLASTKHSAPAIK
jgi:osmotically-inducible protein OsmY